MIKVTLVGQGNVSHHLAKAFQSSKGVDLVAVSDSRKKIHERILEQTEICIIAVSDKAIGAVSEKLGNTVRLVVHTSGSVALNELHHDRRGVFYPLQTFSRNRAVDFSKIPICIEASHKDDVLLLTRLARSISTDVQNVTSSQRKSLHLAAVFANNFTNHLYHIASELCVENGLSFDLLKPLILETAQKVCSLTPFDAQTGPARREDSTTISGHMELLRDSGARKIYNQMSNSIQKTYGKKL